MIRRLSILILALMAGSCDDDAGPAGASPTDTTAEPSTSNDQTNGAGTPDGGMPGSGMPGDGTPGDGMPGDGMPGDGMPGDGMPGDGMPGDGMPGDGMPDSGMPYDGVPDGGMLGDGAPGDGTPGDGTPGNGMPGNGMPDDPLNGDVQPAPWAQLNKTERFAFMANVVVPRMRAILTAVDPSFRKLSCNTCHGENAGAVDFKMPNGMSPLDAADFPLTASDDPKIAQMAKVMEEEVVPTMAALLGTRPRSRQNPTGFGCFGCHGRVE